MGNQKVFANGLPNSDLVASISKVALLVVYLKLHGHHFCLCMSSESIAHELKVFYSFVINCGWSSERFASDIAKIAEIICLLLQCLTSLHFLPLYFSNHES